MGLSLPLFRKFCPVLCSIFFGAYPCFAGSISGKIMLDSTWEQKVFLSYISQFSDLNVASEQFLISETKVAENGEFHFEDLDLNEGWRVYRLHCIKRGDPISTIFIGGREHNHFHFLFNPSAEASIESRSGNKLLKDLEEKNLQANKSLKRILELEEGYHSASRGSQAQKEIEKENYDKNLIRIADAAQLEILSLWCVYLLDPGRNYPAHSAWFSEFTSRDFDLVSYSKPIIDDIRSRELLDGPIENERTASWLVVITTTIISLGIIFYFAMAGRSKSKKPDLGSLTVQERKVFELIIQGKSNKEISQALHVELSTVKSHVNSIFGKLAVDSRATLMHLWLDN